jgi:hypothetical protein
MQNDDNWNKTNIEAICNEPTYKISNKKEHNDRLADEDFFSCLEYIKKDIIS